MTVRELIAALEDSPYNRDVQVRVETVEKTASGRRRISRESIQVWCKPGLDVVILVADQPQRIVEDS
jgi:hypothetical protein